LVPLSEACAEKGLHTFLKRKQARSHAIVSSRTLSVALPDIEELMIQEE
jgi:hypothetical protein